MKLLRILQIVMILCILMIHSTTIYAQHDHGGHGGDATDVQHPPHGGVIIDAGKYKVEMVADLMLKKDQLSFYLLKGNLKPISAKGIAGSVTIKHKDGTSTTENLIIKGNERFVAQLKNADSFQAIVEFSIKGKIVSAFIAHNGLGHSMGIKYTCSMHPEIESDSPGKCPKCGMNLKKIVNNK